MALLKGWTRRFPTWMWAQILLEEGITAVQDMRDKMLEDLSKAEREKSSGKMEVSGETVNNDLADKDERPLQGPSDGVIEKERPQEALYYRPPPLGVAPI